jgi:circadian clock protein KaiB
VKRSKSRRKPAKKRPEHEEPYELKLFITGSTPRSLDAIAQIRRVCDVHLKGRYTLDVIDVHQQPQLAEAEQIIALPTLLRKLPPPLRKFLGGFSQEERLLAILGISTVKKS